MIPEPIFITIIGQFLELLDSKLSIIQKFTERKNSNQYKFNLFKTKLKSYSRQNKIGIYDNYKNYNRGGGYSNYNRNRIYRNTIYRQNYINNFPRQPYQ